jgi:hypothetical protein
MQTSITTLFCFAHHYCRDTAFEIPDPGSDKAMECNIEFEHTLNEGPVANAKTDPDYTSLTYVWSSPEEIKCFTVNGIYFEVPRGVRSFVRVALSGRTKERAGCDISKAGRTQFDTIHCTRSLRTDAFID